MSDQPKSGFTRRDLVRGSLVGAVGAAVGVKAPEAFDVRIGPGPAPLELTVNGAVHRLSVEPRVTLADAIRDRIGLTGTKVVCGRGACGACTVLLDGETVCSCITLAHEVSGKSITTIEGLAAEGRLSPLQEAFVAADALQCGFCTSGMVLSCQRLLTRNPRPTRGEIREAVSGQPLPVRNVQPRLRRRRARRRTEEGRCECPAGAARLPALDVRLPPVFRSPRRPRHPRGHGRGGGLT